MVLITAVETEFVSVIMLFTRLNSKLSFKPDLKIIDQKAATMLITTVTSRNPTSSTEYVTQFYLLFNANTYYISMLCKVCSICIYNFRPSFSQCTDLWFEEVYLRRSIEQTNFRYLHENWTASIGTNGNLEKLCLMNTESVVGPLSPALPSRFWQQK